MNTNPLISTIMIFFNEEKFIKEAIESVFSQTYGHWELLLVDDGSTDGSTAIARYYAEQYPEKVHYLEHHNHENKGMSASLNLGVRHAKGSHISILDGDDVWLSNKLERQIAILASQPEAVMLSAPLQMWYGWTVNHEDRPRDRLWGVGEDGTHPFSNTLIKPPKLLCLFLRDEVFIPSSVLVQREVLLSAGGYEDIFHDCYSDAVVFVKICLTSPVFVSSECMYKYRKHTESCTYKSWHSGKDDAMRDFYLNWIERYFSKQGVKDPEVWQAFKYAKWIHHHNRLHRLKQKIIRLGQRILPVPVIQCLKKRSPYGPLS